jgi:hypothetical protein
MTRGIRLQEPGVCAGVHGLCCVRAADSLRKRQACGSDICPAAYNVSIGRYYSSVNWQPAAIPKAWVVPLIGCQRIRVLSDILLHLKRAAMAARTDSETPMNENCSSWIAQKALWRSDLHEVGRKAVIVQSVNRCSNIVCTSTASIYLELVHT